MEVPRAASGPVSQGTVSGRDHTVCLGVELVCEGLSSAYHCVVHWFVGQKLSATAWVGV